LFIADRLLTIENFILPGIIGLVPTSGFDPVTL